MKKVTIYIVKNVFGYEFYFRSIENARKFIRKHSEPGKEFDPIRKMRISEDQMLMRFED